MRFRSHCVAAFAGRIFVLVLFSGLVAARAEVRVWQSTLALPTYEEGPPDPNPPFDVLVRDRPLFQLSLIPCATIRPAAALNISGAPSIWKMNT